MPPVIPQLTDDALRRIVIRLYDLSTAWAELDAERLARKAQEDLAQKERAMSERELELQRQRTTIVERERDLETQRADFAEAKAKALGKGRGVGCVLKKIFSLGLARCG